MIDVILPVLDEAQALPGVLDGLPAGYRAVVVDNGSRDGSAEIATQRGAVVVHEPRRGFGAACYTGLRATESELVCFMDADGSLDGADLPLVVEPVLGGACELCLGARRAERGSWPWHTRAANRALAFELRRRCGVAITDLGPMRCARRADLLALDLRDRAFGWPLEMVLRAAGAGWRVSEVSVPYRARAGGRSKVSGSFRGSMRAVRDMGRLLA